MNWHLRNDVQQIYIHNNMKIQPFESLVWGSLRLAPITPNIISRTPLFPVLIASSVHLQRGKDLVKCSDVRKTEDRHSMQVERREGLGDFITCSDVD